MKTEINSCSSCKNWNNKQAELDYSTFYGICTCSQWKFNANENSDVVLLDRDNKNKTKHMNVHRFENQSDVVPIGSVDSSIYCFVTN